MQEISSPFIPPPESRGRSLPCWILNKIYSSKPVTKGKAGGEDPISIICISDIHNTRPPLPNGDILLHPGDLSQYGLFDEIQAQLDWLNAQPHRHKIVIAGNHDLILDDCFVRRHADRELDKVGKARGDLCWGDVTYLENSRVQLECRDRTLAIYGSPMTPRCGSFAFQYEHDEAFWTDKVPGDTDILLTHGPPALYLDQGKGCASLLKEIWRARPSLVVFGHIHDARREDSHSFSAAQACYHNVQLDTKPWVNLLKLIIVIIWQKLSRALGFVDSAPTTRLINAAVVAGRGNSKTRAPIVINL